MPQRIWFEREFVLGTPFESFPEILERLRGTPARLEERVSQVPSKDLTRRYGERWSIQEHVGHLADLEPLWRGRVEDLLGGQEELRHADLENTATWQAEHNKAQSEVVLAEFRSQRAELMERLESLSEESLRTATALHPRLRQPMSIVDLCFFVAEHDDHHLATVSTLIGRTQ
ncbi:MAG: DinB family protein [Deltaproteobacteria bacterium]|nr:DinB family protein [Deltaproteobacteria bacterium]